MLVFTIFQVVIYTILFLIKNRIYEYKNDYHGEIVYEKKIKFPLWSYIIVTIAILIPILGLFVDLLLIVYTLIGVNSKDFYFKPIKSKIIDFLNKRI